MSGLEYKLHIPETGGVFAKYKCGRCGQVKDIPYFMYQRGERLRCSKPLSDKLLGTVTKTMNPKRNNTAKKVKCFVLGEEYPSLAAAAKAISVDPASIRRRMIKSPEDYYRIED